MTPNEMMSIYTRRLYYFIEINGISMYLVKVKRLKLAFHDDPASLKMVQKQEKIFF